MNGQLRLDGNKIVDDLDFMIQASIKMYREFEPTEGYYLAFSGGKDSCVIKALADMAKVKYDAHYAITTVDPPELTKFIKKHHADVERHAPDINMWDLIVKRRMPPTRVVRYCCQELKEEGGRGRFVVTGVRKAESSKRSKRCGIEFDAYGSQAKKAKENRQIFLMSDNDEKRRMVEICDIKGKNILNPIIDWTDEHVWKFIERYNIPYCDLYDEGFNRLGCLGCPLSGTDNMIRDFKRFPYVYKQYTKAFDRMNIKRIEDGFKTSWNDGTDVMAWWLGVNREYLETNFGKEV